MPAPFFTVLCQISCARGSRTHSCEEVRAVQLKSAHANWHSTPAVQYKLSSRLVTHVC